MKFRINKRFYLEIITWKSFKDKFLLFRERDRQRLTPATSRDVGSSSSLDGVRRPTTAIADEVATAVNSLIRNTGELAFPTPFLLLPLASILIGSYLEVGGVAHGRKPELPRPSLRDINCGR